MCLQYLRMYVTCMYICTVECKKVNLTYGTAQFELDRTRGQHGLDTTRFSFHTRAIMRVHARKMTSNLRTIQSCCVHTRRVHDSLQTYACMSGMHMPNLDYKCMQIVS